MWLTVKEVSFHYRIKRSTLYFWVESGIVPHYKIGRLIRFKSEEFDAWIKGYRKEIRPVRKRSLKHTDAVISLDIDKTIRKAIEESKAVKI